MQTFVRNTKVRVYLETKAAKSFGRAVEKLKHTNTQLASEILTLDNYLPIIHNLNI